MKCLSRTIVLSTLLSIFSVPCLGVIPLIFVGTSLGLGGAGAGVTIGTTGAVTGLTIGAGAAGAGAAAVAIGAGTATTATVATTTAVATGTGLGLGAGLTAIGTKLGLTTITTKLGLVGLTKAAGVGTVLSFFTPNSSSKTTTTTSSSSRSKTNMKILVNTGKNRGGYSTFFGLLGSGTSKSNSSNSYDSLNSTNKPNNSSSILNLLLVGGSLGVGGLTLIGKTDLGRKLTHDGRYILYVGLANLGKKLKLSDIGDTLGLKRVITDIGKNFEWNKFTKMASLSTFFGLVGASGSSNTSSTKNTDTLKNIVKKTAKKVIKDMQGHQTKPITEKPTTTTTTKNTDMSLKSSSKGSSNINISNSGSLTNTSGGTYSIDQKMVNKVVTKFKEQALLKKTIAPLIQNTITAETTNTISLLCKSAGGNLISDAYSGLKDILGFGDSPRPPDIKTVSVHNKSCDAVGTATPTSANALKNQSFVSTVPHQLHRNGASPKGSPDPCLDSNGGFHLVKDGLDIKEERFQKYREDFAKEHGQQTKKPTQQPVQLLGQIPIQQTTFQQTPTQQTQNLAQLSPVKQISPPQTSVQNPQIPVPTNPVQVKTTNTLNINGNSLPPKPTIPHKPVIEWLTEQKLVQQNSVQPEPIKEKSALEKLIEPPKSKTVPNELLEKIPMLVVGNIIENSRQQSQIQEQSIPQNIVQQNPVQQTPYLEAKCETNIKQCLAPLEKYAKQEGLDKKIFEFIAPKTSTHTSEVSTKTGISTTTNHTPSIPQAPVQQTPVQLIPAQRSPVPLEKSPEKDSLGNRIFKFIAPEISQYTSDVLIETAIQTTKASIVARMVGRKNSKIIQMPYTLVTQARTRTGTTDSKILDYIIDKGIEKGCYYFVGNEAQEKIAELLTTNLETMGHHLLGTNLFAIDKNLPSCNGMIAIPYSPDETWYNGNGNEMLKNAAPIIGKFTSVFLTEGLITAGTGPASRCLIGKNIQVLRPYTVSTTTRVIRSTGYKSFDNLISASIGRGIFYGTRMQKIQDVMANIITDGVEMIGDSLVDAKKGIWGKINKKIKQLNAKGSHIWTIPTISPRKLEKSLDKKVKEHSIKCKIL